MIQLVIMILLPQKMMEVVYSHLQIQQVDSVVIMIKIHVVYVEVIMNV